MKRLLCVALPLLFMLVGCDSEGEDDPPRGDFTATLRGAANLDLEGGAIFGPYTSPPLFDFLFNFGMGSSGFDLDLRDSPRRGVSFVRRDTSALGVGTYPLVDVLAAAPRKVDSSRVRAFVLVDEGAAFHSRGGELVIEEAARGILRGRFAFSAARVADTSAAARVTIEGSFEAVRRQDDRED